MCQFFSCISDGGGNIKYFDAAQRALARQGKLITKTGSNITVGDCDSHSAQCSYYEWDCDRVNKYEFRPLDKKFHIDQLNNKRDDSIAVKKKLRRMDYNGLIPELIIKPIVHPWKCRDRKKVTNYDIVLLRFWASVHASVGASVRDSVWDSVCDSVWDSARESVRDSVRDSVWASVRHSVGASVGASVWDSARESVWASVGAYTGSFFMLDKWKYIKHKEGEYPYQPLVDLWHRGLVPSFDGKTWRLHGPKGRILKEITKKELAGYGKEGLD